MKHLLFSILFLLPWSVNAQTVGTVPATQVEILKAEAAKKAKEAKEAAEQATQTSQPQKDSWTIPQQTKPEQKPSTIKNNNPYEGYLAGAVPEKDGKVVFELKEPISDINANELYKRVYAKQEIVGLF